jgi:hypothetical protein
MTDIMENRGIRVGLPADEVIAAARELAVGGRWQRALALLDAAVASDDQVRGRIAVAAAECALDSDWFGGTQVAAERLRGAEEVCAAAGMDAETRWDLDFVQARLEYSTQLRVDGAFRFGPDGRDPAEMARLRHRTEEVRDRAPDDVRRGWAEMYLGLIMDNIYGDRVAAPTHYEVALRAGETGDDLLAREALRHLGDHDHDNGDHELALDRWRRATAHGARAGAVPGTLSQQMLLAVLARDSGDEAGAIALAGEIARWAQAIGAVHIAAQATAFVAGADPTAGPPDVTQTEQS